ncbi:MAG: ATPase domain-containing protein [bacterium]|nr:ATPase domain-containing protein [bacterium]
MSTGLPALDKVLGGGFPENSITMICGRPGTGKSILAQQMVFANAGPGRRAAYLTTLSEPFEKTLRYLQGISFYSEDLLLESILYRDLADGLTAAGLEGLLATVVGLVKEERPRLLVIDSFKAIGDLTGRSANYRSSLFELARLLSAYSCTSFWVGEYSEVDSGRPEFAIADGILELVNQKRGTRDERYLRVVKLRGSPFLPGEHSFRIGPDGLEVFPRSCLGATAPLDCGEELVPTGMTPLDALLSGGFYRGSNTMVMGPSGVGKTVLGLQFVAEAARRGENAVYLSLQEHPGHLRRTAGALGLRLEPEGGGQVRILYMSPVETLIDEVVFRLLEAVDQTAASHAVVDALGELAPASWDRSRYTGFIYSLNQALKARGVTAVVNYELAEQFRTDRLSQDCISNIADNVITLVYTPGATLGRGLRVVKARATVHSTRQVPFSIGVGGLSGIGAPDAGP